MQLTLQRNAFSSAATLGTLTLPDGWQCYTLELPVRDGLPGSAIPTGTYRVALLPSPRFEGRGFGWDSYIEQYASVMPRLLGIPNRDGILIHWGNTPANTDGCILVGTTQEAAENFIGGSREAFAELHARMVAAETAGETIEIEVTGEPTAPSLSPNATAQG